MKKQVQKLNVKTHIKKIKTAKNRNAMAIGLFAALFALIGVATLLTSRAAVGNDLVVTSITTSPASPSAGQAVTFSAVVKNQGTTATTAGTVVGVAFYVDNVKVSWNQSNTAALAAGASVTLTANAGSPGATWTATTGPHTVRAVADDANVIPDESNEANNALSTSLTIGNTGSLYITPATQTVNVGTNATTTLRLNPGVGVDGVEAVVTYDQTKLTFVSVSGTGSPFDVELGAQTGGGGTVTITRGNLSGGVSTDSLVATLVFRAVAGTGNTTLQLTGNATQGGAYTNPSITSATINFVTPDTTAPATSITAPAAGAALSNTQTVTANATDATGVTKVEFWMDGQLLGSDTTSPYSFSLDTTKYATGAHSLQTKAYDAAGNVGTSAAVNITIKNFPEDINQDGIVNLLDFSLLVAKFGQTGTGLGRADINVDGKVDLRDFSLLASKFGQ